MPHKPLAASDAFYTPDTPDDLYADVIREMDWSVGEIFQTLEKEGLLENTIFIFMSDNGPHYGGSTGGLKGKKATSWEGGRIDTTPDDIKTKDIPDVVAKTDLTMANLHQYVYALPVSSLCSGCREFHEIEENIAVLNNLKKLTDTDKQRLIELAKPYANQIVENYKRVLT